MEVVKKLIGVLVGHIDPSDNSTTTRRLFTLGAGLGGLIVVLSKVAAFLCSRGITTACN